MKNYSVDIIGGIALCMARKVIGLQMMCASSI